MTSSRRTALTFGGLLIVGVLSMVITDDGGRVRPDAAVRSVVGFIQRGLSATGSTITGSIRSVGELRRLRGEYELLLGELERYQQLEGSIATLERENERLREQLGFAARVELDTVAARVIAIESGPVFNSFVINRGTRHGVAEDQAVFAFVGGRQGLVGRINEVAGGTALIVPVTAPGSYVSARLDRSRHEGLLEGSGAEDRALTLRFIPREARNQIQYDDLVVTSGLNSLFPPELPIGRVLRVDSPAYEASLTVSIEPFVDFSRLEYVFVLTGPGATTSQAGAQ